MRSNLPKLTILSTSISLILSGCGGGGGGGTSATLSPYLRSEVPFYTPVKITTVDPLVNSSGTEHKAAVVDLFVEDITSTGSQDVIIAGRMTQNTTVADWGNSKIHMMSWENGTLVDKTNQWFPGGINEILGTEPSVKFEDFFKTGRKDMLVAPSTDMQHYGPAYVFTNNGNNFSRQSIALNNVWAHDSAVADLNGDTFKDIVFTDYGPNTTFAINDRVSGFTTYTDVRGNAGDLYYGGSSVAVADFLGNGSKQLVMTDSQCNTQTAGCDNSKRNKLYNYSLDTGTSTLTFSWHSDLPTARFDLPKWSGYGFNGQSHNVRAVAYDFDDDNNSDVLIFSRPGNTTTAKYSEIQFLKNNGTGSFSDVTDTVLVNYNTNTFSTYNPRFIDLNGDGKIDILVSGSDPSGSNSSTQFLLKSSDGKYVGAYQNIITDFIKQSSDLQNSGNSFNTVTVFKAPNGKLYLVTAVNFSEQGETKLAVYLSELGTSGVTSAQTAINLIQQKWPYMSAIQANDMLAQTSATYFGGKIIDLETLLNPIGAVTINSAGKPVPVIGHITGLDFGSGNAIIQDGLGRPFMTNLKPMALERLNSFGYSTWQIDQHNLSSHAEYLVGSPSMNLQGIRVASNNNPADPQANKHYSIGVPSLYRNGSWNFGVQYTNLSYNPWIGFSGAWGSVNSSQIMDHVVTYRSNGFSAQASMMHVTTNINPGLITKVNDMIGTWAEVGYRANQDKKFGDIGLYLGIKPMVLSGSVEANLPTNVDNQGNLVYTNKRFSVLNQTTGYVRALYSKDLSKTTQLRLSGVVTSDGQYRMMNEFKWSIQ